jgi:hypothetical protein
MEYVREFIEDNPKIPPAMTTSSIEKEGGPTGPETVPEGETDGEENMIDSMGNNCQGEDDDIT